MATKQNRFTINSGVAITEKNTVVQCLINHENDHTIFYVYDAVKLVHSIGHYYKVNLVRLYEL